MCSNKNAISILQELAAVKTIDNPVYTVSVIPTGFKYEIKCGDVTASAVACNKKIAKHECATQALLKLQYLIDTTSFTSNVIVSKQENNFNAIGKLNEICSQSALPYPVYVDGFVENGNFIVQCKCLTYISTGRATTKKLAKQFAAQEMLNKLQSVDFKQCNNTLEKQDAHVIEVYKQLKETGPAYKLKTEDSLVPACEEMQLEPKKVEVQLNQEELSEKLRDLGISYDIKPFQDNPLILIMNASGPKGEHYTFLESRGSYSSCKALLLQNAITGINVLNNKAA